MGKTKDGAISAEAVQKATGKTWDEWFAILDAPGARGMTHQQIVAVLSGQHDVGPWWQQMVTVSYEQERGLRKKHERPDGYQISRSKTIAASAGDVFAAWKDRRKRAKWLAGNDITIRTETENKCLRITWSDETTWLDVMLYAKGDSKTQITVQHSRIKSAAEAEKLKAYWGERLEKLQEMLEK